MSKRQLTFELVRTEQEARAKVEQEIKTHPRRKYKPTYTEYQTEDNWQGYIVWYKC